MIKRPEVTIVIVTYNQLPYTKQCLQLISEQTQDVDYEIVLVDNGSTDGTVEYFKDLERLGLDYHIIYNKDNKGFAAGCNQGIKASKGKHVCLLNNDTAPQPKWLRSMVDLAESNEKIGIVGSLLMFPDKRLQHLGFVYPLFGEPHHPYYGAYLENLPDRLLNKLTEPHPVEGVTFACALITDKVLHWSEHQDIIEGMSTINKLLDEKSPDNFTLPILDTQYINGYEDVDYNLQVRYFLGLEIWLQPMSCLIHFEHQSFKSAEAVETIKQQTEKEGVNPQQLSLDRLREKWWKYRYGTHVKSCPEDWTRHA